MKGFKNIPVIFNWMNFSVEYENRVSRVAVKTISTTVSERSSTEKSNGGQGENKGFGGVYVCLLQECIHKTAFLEGKSVHAHIVKNGFASDSFLGNNLINMYVKCGCPTDGRQVFDKMPRLDVVSWTTMVAGYTQNELGREALELFSQMQRLGKQGDEFVFACVLRACASLAALDYGKQLHGHVIRNGFKVDIFVGGTLLDMYIKCGRIDDARKVFDKMPERNVIAWTAIISGYAQQGYGEEAFKLFCQMQEEGIKPNGFTFATALSICASLGVLEEGMRIYADIIKTGFESHVSVGNALAALYARLGSIKDARQVFDNIPQSDVVSWTTMISGYVKQGYDIEALRLFCEMQRAGMRPSKFTFASILGACASLANLEHGKQIHSHIIKTRLDSCVFVGSALVDMYAKCQSPEVAHQVFGKLSERNVVLWTAMIAGYVQHGQGEEAMQLLCEMHREGIKPNEFTFASVLCACASLAALQQGEQIHTLIIKTESELFASVQNALVTMYARCGSIEDAFCVFERISKQDVILWNAMIAGYAQHGYGERVLRLFGQMQQAGVMPNHITFINVLSACSHAGLVHEGYQYFKSMSQYHCITPRLEHYACMVDLLGRAGRLDEAVSFINRMPIEPDANVWGALLGACRVHGNSKLGKQAADCLLELQPRSTGTHVLLANIYAVAGRWHDAEHVRKIMKEKGLKKEPGHSWIEVKNRIHSFGIGDRSHPQTEKIYTMLEKLDGQMKEAGYMPETSFVLHDVEEEQKQHILSHHSEKLANAFGLINTSPGITIRISKNLRVCGDCHTATKFISMIVGRVIIVRDANRFHHFRDGLCSCGDYW